MIIDMSILTQLFRDGKLFFLKCKRVKKAANLESLLIRSSFSYINIQAFSFFPFNFEMTGPATESRISAISTRQIGRPM